MSGPPTAGNYLSLGLPQAWKGIKNKFRNTFRRPKNASAMLNGLKIERIEKNLAALQKNLESKKAKLGNNNVNADEKEAISGNVEQIEGAINGRMRELKNRKNDRNAAVEAAKLKRLNGRVTSFKNTLRKFFTRKVGSMFSRSGTRKNVMNKASRALNQLTNMGGIANSLAKIAKSIEDCCEDGDKGSVAPSNLNNNNGGPGAPGGNNGGPGAPGGNNGGPGAPGGNNGGPGAPGGNNGASGPVPKINNENNWNAARELAGRANNNTGNSNTNAGERINNFGQNVGSLFDNAPEGPSGAPFPVRPGNANTRGRNENNAPQRINNYGANVGSLFENAPEGPSGAPFPVRPGNANTRRRKASKSESIKGFKKSLLEARKRLASETDPAELDNIRSLIRLLEDTLRGHFGVDPSNLRNNAPERINNYGENVGSLFENAPNAPPGAVYPVRPGNANIRGTGERENGLEEGSGAAPPKKMKGPRPEDLAVFGLAPGATWAEVKKAYRKLAMKEHPNKGGNGALWGPKQAAYDRLEIAYNPELANLGGAEEPPADAKNAPPRENNYGVNVGNLFSSAPNAPAQYEVARPNLRKNAPERINEYGNVGNLFSSAPNAPAQYEVARPNLRKNAPERINEYGNVGNLFANAPNAPAQYEVARPNLRKNAPERVNEYGTNVGNLFANAPNAPAAYEVARGNNAAAAAKAAAVVAKGAANDAKRASRQAAKNEAAAANQPVTAGLFGNNNAEFEPGYASERLGNNFGNVGGLYNNAKNAPAQYEIAKGMNNAEAQARAANAAAEAARAAAEANNRNAANAAAKAAEAAAKAAQKEADNNVKRANRIAAKAEAEAANQPSTAGLFGNNNAEFEPAYAKNRLGNNFGNIGGLFENAPNAPNNYEVARGQVNKAPNALPNNMLRGAEKGLSRSLKKSNPLTNQNNNLEAFKARKRAESASAAKTAANNMVSEAENALPNNMVRGAEKGLSRSLKKSNPLTNGNNNLEAFKARKRAEKASVKALANAPPPAGALGLANLTEEEQERYRTLRELNESISEANALQMIQQNRNREAGKGFNPNKIPLGNRSKLSKKKGKGKGRGSRRR